MTFTIFRINNGWIVQPYESTGVDRDDLKRGKTYVFTTSESLARFLTNYGK